MKAIPLYELSWRELAKENKDSMEFTRRQTHSVEIEREAALSLFSALDAAPDFYEVEMKKSKSTRWVTDLDTESATADDSQKDPPPPIGTES